MHVCTHTHTHTHKMYHGFVHKHLPLIKAHQLQFGLVPSVGKGKEGGEMQTLHRSAQLRHGVQRHWIGRSHVEPLGVVV